MYQFDKAADRRSTSCTKWDRYKARYDLDNVIPYGWQIWILTVETLLPMLYN